MSGYPEPGEERPGPEGAEEDPNPTSKPAKKTSTHKRKGSSSSQKIHHRRSSSNVSGNLDSSGEGRLFIEEETDVQKDDVNNEVFVEEAEENVEAVAVGEDVPAEQQDAQDDGDETAEEGEENCENRR